MIIHENRCSCELRFFFVFAVITAVQTWKLLFNCAGFLLFKLAVVAAALTVFV